MRFSSTATLLALAAFPAVAAGVQVDLHLDTPTQMLVHDLPLDAPSGLEGGLAQLRAGGTDVAVMVLWPPRRGDHLARTLALLDRVESEAARLDGVGIVRDPDAARALAGKGGVALVLALEGAHGLGDDDPLGTLRRLHDRGLSILGLTWSFSNRFAGSSGDEGGGLTDEGRELVALARELGVVVDLSHASRATTLDVCRASPVPVIASHSDAWALRHHPRNLTDEEIRCIADTGGVIGVNLHATFLGAPADVGRVADHVEHLAAVGGRGAVALGSDYDGMIRTPAGMPDAGSLPALWAELARRGWSEADLAGLRGGNFLRAWAAVRAAAGAP